MSRLTKFGDYAPTSTLIAECIEKLGGNYFLSFFGIRPATVAIATEEISDDDWHAVAVGLTGVMDWRLSERGGNDFYFAFEAAPAAYATAFGWISGQSEITAIYAKRKSTTTITVELVTWTA